MTGGGFFGAFVAASISFIVFSVWTLALFLRYNMILFYCLATVTASLRALIYSAAEGKSDTCFIFELNSAVYLLVSANN